MSEFMIAVVKNLFELLRNLWIEVSSFLWRIK